MKRLAIAILLVAACSGKSKTGTGTTAGSGSAVLAKKIVVTWGIQQKASGADVFLQTTDETGKQVSHPLGSYQGQCQVIKPVEEMRAATGVNCSVDSAGTELHAVVSDGEIIVLKMSVQVGVTPDPMAREEVTRVKAPSGAAIEAG